MSLRCLNGHVTRASSAAIIEDCNLPKLCGPANVEAAVIAGGMRAHAGTVRLP